jgi:hypothetical protein
VEFLIALVPLLITFFSFVQIAQIATARLVVKHAAIVGARAASVISNAHGNTPDQKMGDNQSEIEQGVKAALGPWLKTMESVTVQITDNSSCDDPYGKISVKVSTQYRCSVPLGNFVCARGGLKHALVFTHAFPHQGARYKDGGGGKCDNADDGPTKSPGGVSGAW